LGIFISLSEDTSDPPWQPFQPGWSFEFVSSKRAPLLCAGRKGKEIWPRHALLRPFKVSADLPRNRRHIGSSGEMAIVHTYDLNAASGKADDLGSALEALAEAVKSIAGSQGAMVLRDVKDAQRFLFLEFWADEPSRKAAGAQLPKEVMGRIMGSVTGAIGMADYDRIAG
jgi:quinol monooxygenase YgiN